MSPDAHESKEIGLEGENEPEAEAHASFPDAASVELSDSKAGVQMRLSQGSRKRQHHIEKSRFPVRREIQDVALKTLGESELHRRGGFTF